MGKRGPGASRGPRRTRDKRRKPWELPGLSRYGRVEAFLEWLPVTRGILAGKNIELIPEEKEWLRGVYGPSNEDGLRTVREALLSVARKNGKTTLVSGLCWCHLSGPEAESYGECYSAAADRDQSSIIFNEMKAMAMMRPYLWGRVNIKHHEKAIEDEENGSRYHALSRQTHKAHGLNASFVACDELAQWTSRDLYDVLKTSQGARAEPLLVTISTQSPDPAHLMSQLVDYTYAIESGEVEDPTFFGKVYAAPEDADIFDKKNWHLANPALGKFRSLEEMRVAAERAKQSKAFEPAFRNLYLNQRADSVAQLIARTDWEACGTPLRDLEGRPCYLGVDLAERRDLTAIVCVFPDDGFDVLPFFWLPDGDLKEKANEDKVPYELWKREGHLLTTPGRVVRYKHVAPTLREIFDNYDVRGIAYDRWHIQTFAESLGDTGLFRIDREGSQFSIDGIKAIPFGQGFKDMAPAVDLLEAAIVDKELRHANHPVLTMCAANVKAEIDPSGNRKFTKEKSHGRIDGIVALAMALSAAVAGREVKTVRPWDNPEFEIAVL